MAVETDAAASVVALRAHGAWKGGVETEVSVRDFAPLTMDEPPALGGEDRGPNPMEYVLAGLIGCESVMLAVIAQEQGLEYTSADFEVKGLLDVRGLQGVEGVRPYFSSVKGSVTVTTQASQEALDQVAEAIEARCPVITMLRAAGVDLEIRWIAKAA